MLQGYRVTGFRGYCVIEMTGLDGYRVKEFKSYKFSKRRVLIFRSFIRAITLQVYKVTPELHEPLDHLPKGYPPLI